MKLLASPYDQRDNCGVGFIANLNGSQSHCIVEKSIESVINLTHRGAVSADGKTGDGAGILTQIPFKLLQKEMLAKGVKIEDGSMLGVGMVFLPIAWEEALLTCFGNHSRADRQRLL